MPVGTAEVPGSWASFIALGTCCLSGFYLLSQEYLIGGFICIGSLLSFLVYHSIPIKKHRSWHALILIIFTGLCIPIQIAFTSIFVVQTRSPDAYPCPCLGYGCRWIVKCDRDVHLQVLALLISLYSISVAVLALCVHTLFRRHLRLVKIARNGSRGTDRIQETNVALISAVTRCQPAAIFPGVTFFSVIHPNGALSGRAVASCASHSSLSKPPESETIMMPLNVPPPPYSEVIVQAPPQALEPPPYA